jgi:hypothetical protein
VLWHVIHRSALATTVSTSVPAVLTSSSLQRRALPHAW